MYEGMPDLLEWETVIAAKTEPGERLEISGRVFKADGKTPAAGIILYVYHTDAQGRYSPSMTQTHARRHGHLRGWMKTIKDGRYKFHTIRPASYPNSRVTQHIHPIVKEPDKNEYYIDEFQFDDDPFLSNNEPRSAENRGGSGLLHLRKNSRGVWVGTRDIVLGKNILNYR